MTTSASDALDDELTSINSIFDPDTLARIDASTYALRLPSLPSVVLRLAFPSDYPDAPPSILGTQSVGDGAPRGAGTQAAAILRNVLEQTYRPGEACVFDMLEEARDELEQLRSHDAAGVEGDRSSTINQDAPAARIVHSEDHRVALPSDPPGLEPMTIAAPQWTVAPAVTEKKSVFVARCAHATSPTLAAAYIAHLLQTDRRCVRATHNIRAWRIRGPSVASTSTGGSGHGATAAAAATAPTTAFQDCDDDGEAAAGGRVLHLMQVMDVWDVVVVVTRWYGGVQLGPDRFRIINNCARDALVLGGFAKAKTADSAAPATSAAGEKSSKGKKGKKGL